MRIIIGLGNIGQEYENTRHNLGFSIVDLIAKQYGGKFSFEKKFNAEVAKSRFSEKPVILAKPHTFVNKSGEAVRKIRLFYKVKPEDIIIIHDDLDIAFGNSKLGFDKSSGGHRGMQSIIDNLKTQKFWQLKIGTANRKLETARDQQTLKAKKESVGDFVLSKFTPAEQAKLKAIQKGALIRLENIF